ncbi:MAG TPA: hypothetical protein VEI07_13235 [Planctomycetaceae bacterium]|nr:hypothetical protein [Planctomycetaceae bacterium]
MNGDRGRDDPHEDESDEGRAKYLEEGRFANAGAAINSPEYETAYRGYGTEYLCAEPCETLDVTSLLKHVVMPGNNNTGKRQDSRDERTDQSPANDAKQDFHSAAALSLNGWRTALTTIRLVFGGETAGEIHELAVDKIGG